MPALVSEEFGPEVFEAVERIWKETGVGNPLRGDTLASVEETLRHGGRLLTVRSPKDEVLAVCWITDDGRRLYLHHMAVSPSAQGKGYARLLMERTVQIALERGRQVKIEVHRDNARARKLYERYGFAPLSGYDTFILRDPKASRG
ncbi:MAG TPA: GNAT family N-acetyltransferase [Myxococcales bacterium]|jgi:ribosomal protein S18 acetylase RimI-like enzyme